MTLRDKSLCNRCDKKSIIIAGEWHSSNLGDEIICKTFQHLLQTVLKSNDYKILPLDISMRQRIKIGGKLAMHLLGKIHKKIGDNYYQYIKIRAIRLEVEKLVEKYVISNVIIPGGEIFQKYFAYSVYALVSECLKYNIPISFNACGYGPNNHRSVSLFKWIIEQPCISQITTRDNIASLTKKDIKVIPDAAIMAYHYYDFKPYNKQEQIIGINIIAPAYYIDCSNDKISYEDFNKKMIAILKELSKTYKILLFSNGDINDQLYAAWLYNKVQDLNVAIEERPTNGFELIKIIYKLSLVIGFRLHSLITAYSYDIPAIGIAWDNKLNYWGKMTENKNIYVLSEFPIINIGELSGELIKKGIDKKKKVALESEIIEQIKTYI